jgi:Polyketide cyclase / dehydrase and lipid transport
MKVKVRTTLPASPKDVWSVIEPIERHVDWMADAESISFTSSQTRGVGTTFDCVTRIGPFRTVDRMEVTAWDPPRRLAIEHHGLFTGAGRFSLRRTRDGGTRFTWTERITFPWWLGGPVGALCAKPVLHMVWRGNLRRLRDLVASG